MKTDYKILWIDDNYRNVRGHQRNINQFLDEHGIKLDIKAFPVTPDKHPTTDAEFARIVDDIELDMVFIDYNMPENGDKIIQHIRKTLHHYYLPILFYTSDNDAQTTLQNRILAVNKKETDEANVADGIYFCDRDFITDKAKLILTSLLKKEARPQQGRGLLMDRVSEIDANITKNILRFWDSVPAAKQAAVVKALQERLDDKKKKSKDLRDALDGLSYPEIKKFIGENAVKLETFARAKVLREIFRSISAYNDSGDIVSKYCSNTPIALNDLRNNYAHKTSQELIPEHNEQRCKFIRTETRLHLDNFKKVDGTS